MNHPVAPIGRALRDIGIGAGSAGALLYLTFFASAGAIEVATLATSGGLLVWFASVPAGRLTGTGGMPRAALFGLVALAGVVVWTSASTFGSGTVLASTLTVATAVAVGLVRAVRHGFLAETAGIDTRGEQ